MTEQPTAIGSYLEISASSTSVDASLGMMWVVMPCGSSAFVRVQRSHLRVVGPLHDDDEMPLNQWGLLLAQPRETGGGW